VNVITIQEKNRATWKRTFALSSDL